MQNVVLTNANNFYVSTNCSTIVIYKQKIYKMKLKLPKWLQQIKDKRQETKFVKLCFDEILHRQHTYMCDQTFYDRSLKNIPNNVHELPDDSGVRVPCVPMYNVKTSQLYWFHVTVDKYCEIVSCKLVDKTYAPTWDADMIEERLQHLYKSYQDATNKEYINNENGERGCVTFVIKPGYPIFTKHRTDVSKTDVQQTEAFAIARMINESNHYYTKSIVVVQDENVGSCVPCQNTVVCDIDWALKMIKHSKHVKINVYVTNCVWPTVNNDLFNKHMQLIESADNITWLWYDIREHMMPQLNKIKFVKNAKVQVWTQGDANAIELLLKESGHVPNVSFTVQHLELQTLPKYYWCKETGYAASNELNIGRAEFADGKPQIVFPICRWQDMSVQRQQLIESLLMNEDVHVSVVGSLEGMPTELQQRFIYFGTIKTTNMIAFMSKFDATIVLDEPGSLNANAMTFRGIEGMLANIPVLYVNDCSTINNDKFKPFDSIDDAISWLNYARSKKVVITRYLTKQHKALQAWSEQLNEQLENLI